MPDLISDLLNAITKRQEKSTLVAHEAINTSKAAAGVVSTYAQRASEVESEILARRKKAMHARELSSGGFMDMAELVGKAFLDPGGYDPQIRAKRNAEDANYLSLLGTTTDIQLSALQKNLEVSLSELKATEVGESIALERAQQAATINQIRTQELTGTLQLQDATIATKTPEEIESILKQPADASGRINIGGVDVPRIKLVEHKANLDHQRVARLVMAKADSEAEMAVGQDAFLRSSSKLELSQIRANNYMVDGVAFNSELVDSWYQKKVIAEADLIKDQVEQIKLQNQPQYVVSEAAEQVARLRSALPTDSPMQFHLQRFNSAIGMSQALIESGEPHQKAAAIITTDTALKVYTEAAKKQALIDSPTDKQLQAAREEYYLSGEIPQERLAGITVERLAANKPLVGVMGPEDARMIQNLHREVYNQLVTDAQAGDFSGNLSATRIKELKSEAAIVAYDKWKQERGAQVADSAFQNQVTVASIPGMNVAPHPLYGIESPLQFRRKFTMAVEHADEILQESLGLSRDQIDQVLVSGKMPDGSNLSIHQFKAERDHLINVGFMQQYSPEQGKAILDWMSKYGDAYISTVVNGAASNASGFESAASLSIAKDAAKDEFYSSVDGLSLALDSALQEPADRLVEFAFGDPEPYQAVALQMSESLTDNDRSLLWNKYIAPVIVKAKEMRLRGKEAHTFIERTIGTMEMDSPEAKKAWKTFQRDRKKSLESIDQMMNGWFFFLPRTGLTSTGNIMTKPGTVRPTPMMGSPESIISRSANALPFYKEYLKGKSQ